MKKKTITIAAVVILLLALIFQFYMQNLKSMSRNSFYGELLQQQVTTEELTSNSVKIMSAEGELIGYAGLDTYNGFGGPMLVGVATDATGRITDVKILEHKETPQYLERIAEEGFFQQYDGRNVADGTAFGTDIEGISGATMSTRAIAVCADRIAESIRVRALGLPAQASAMPWQLGLPEFVVAALIAACVCLAQSVRLRKLRPFILMASVAGIGLWLNRPVTMAYVSSTFMTYFPQVKNNLIWYALLAIALLPPLLAGKNYYCTYLCPFGAVQEGIHFVTSKVNLPLSNKLPFLRKTRNLLVFVALLAAFLFQNPSVSSYEPFTALFQTNGTKIQELLLGSVLLAAVFFRRFWCMGFCPVGGFLDFIASLRRSLHHKEKEHPATREAITSAPACGLQDVCEKTMRKKEKLAEGLFKLFYAAIVFSVFISIFERWSFM